MTKVVIVDDEFYFRQYLKSCIDWEGMGCHISGEASDGEEGLLLVEREEPEIVILDINMPIIDGIEFSKLIYERKLETRIIILSGHSEFQYAQKAMKYGVKSYLLKPLNEEELCQAIREISKEMEALRSYQVKLTSLEKQVKRNQPLLEEKLLNDLIRGVISAGSAHGKMSSEPKGMNLEYHFFVVLVMEIDDFKSRQWDVADKELWKYAVRNIAQELIPGNMHPYFCVDERDSIVCLLCGDVSKDNSKAEIRKCVLQIAEFISKHLPFTVTIGIGNAASDPGGITTSYQQALFSLKNKYNSGGNSVVDYEKTKSFISQNTLIHSGIRNELIMGMRQGERESVQCILKKIFREAQELRISYDMLQCHCMEFIFTCLEYLEEVSVPFTDIFPQMQSPMEMLDGIHTISQAESSILDLFDKALCYIGEHKNTRGMKQMEEIKAYIAEHFCEAEFKINDIAGYFYVNYHYLCHSFKKQTGITLNQYITSLRIERAKTLIDQGCRNMTLLAEQVGYGALGYFGKCFKKYTGVSPSKYMEKIE